MFCDRSACRGASRRCRGQAGRRGSGNRCGSFRWRRTDAFASGENAVAHGLMDGSWTGGFLREEALQGGVDGQAVFFKEGGEFHRGGSGMGHESRAALKLRSLFPALFRARRARRRVFHRPSSAEFRHDLRLLRAASGTRGKAPRLPRIVSWLRPGRVAGFRGGEPPLRDAPGTSQNPASWAALVFLQVLSSRDEPFLVSKHLRILIRQAAILRHVAEGKQCLSSDRSASAAVCRGALAEVLRLPSSGSLRMTLLPGCQDGLDLFTLHGAGFRVKICFREFTSARSLKGW